MHHHLFVTAQAGRHLHQACALRLHLHRRGHEALGRAHEHIGLRALAHHGLGRQRQRRGRPPAQRRAPRLHELVGAQALGRRALHVSAQHHRLVARRELRVQRHEAGRHRRAIGAAAAEDLEAVAHAHVRGLLGLRLQLQRQRTRAREPRHRHARVEPLARAGQHLDHRGRHRRAHRQAGLQAVALRAGAHDLEHRAPLGQRQPRQFSLAAGLLHAHLGNQAFGEQLLVAHQPRLGQLQLVLRAQPLALPLQQIRTLQPCHRLTGAQGLARAYRHLLHHAGQRRTDHQLRLRRQHHRAREFQRLRCGGIGAVHPLGADAGGAHLLGAERDRCGRTRGRRLGPDGCGAAQRAAERRRGQRLTKFQHVVLPAGAPARSQRGKESGRAKAL
ncbi:MAG: hypothetical protein HZY78_06205 [Burkholderiaceae bacterium]|nr:MAG: hypothetical protein HZY78_06205 [Burkholderiaceae bacterium]